MKIIFEREMTRLSQMVSSNDKQMRELAVTILKKKEVIRFSYTLIAAFHALLFIGSLTGAVWISYHYDLKLYWIPLIATCGIQAILSFSYVMNIKDFRLKYNKNMQ